jgi:FixJ family two-component response regulator
MFGSHAKNHALGIGGSRDTEMDCGTCVFVVDDDTSVLRSLGRLLHSVGYSVVGFTTAQAILDYPEPQRASCVVLDLTLPDVNGLQIQAELFARGVECPIVFLTGRAEVATGIEAMRAGAWDFLIKPVDPSVLIDVVASAVFRYSILREQYNELTELSDRWDSLTPRERQVCQLVAQGRLNKEIAAELGTAEKTVKVHRSRAMRKLRARRMADLVRMANEIKETSPLE